VEQEPGLELVLEPRRQEEEEPLTQLLQVVVVEVEEVVEEELPLPEQEQLVQELVQVQEP
jgi:hypothetical protein